MDVRLAGDWKQMQDFTSFPGEDFAAFLYDSLSGQGLHKEVCVKVSPA